MSDKRRANDTLPTLDMSKTLVDQAPANNAADFDRPIDETVAHTPIAKARSSVPAAMPVKASKKRASIAPAPLSSSAVSSKMATKTKSLPPPSTMKATPIGVKGKASKVADLAKTMPATDVKLPPAELLEKPVSKAARPAYVKKTASVRPRRLSLPPEEGARPTLESVAPEDQVSIPPASDLGDGATERMESLPAPVLVEEVDARHLHMLAMRGQGPSRAQRYMKAAAGVAAVLAMAFLVRVTIAKLGQKPVQTAHAAAAGQVTPSQPQIPAPPPVQEAQPAAAPAAPAKTAMEEKKAALAALEKRDLTEAIAAGERSVDLDPTDADAWRVLGAAYQDAGRMADARRCYQECGKVAKKGEVRECGFLLQ